jgi:hypothetical protein
MKSCPLCKVKISFSSSLCADCKIIKSFITIKGKDIVLKWIQNYGTPPQSRVLYPTAPQTYT